MEGDSITHEAVVGVDGLIRVPGVIAGEIVKVTILRGDKGKPSELAPDRFGGWAKGKVRILPGFDDPIPGMEEYF